jgi:carboxyl-terminal processing protease
VAKKLIILVHQEADMRISTSVILTPLRCITLFAALLYLPISSATATETADTVATADTAKEQAQLPLKDLRLFTLIFDHIRRSYVDPISDQQLLENAIKGMLGEMDPHSAYLDASSFEQLQESTQGEFSGVGIEMGSEDGFIKVIAPIDDTPAQKAGIVSGDLIIKIDQESIQGLSISEAAQKIRGPEGSSVVFTVIRNSSDKPIDITVVRGKIKSISVRSRLIKESIAYIRISQFQTDTGKEFTRAIEKLRSQQANLDGLIVDLRNNPGGILQASVQVVDSLINKGVIVSTKGRLDHSNTVYNATPGDETNGLPVVVLVNGGSASASEIVAGALQDYQRAVIMGTRTFGKGSVQTILPVGEKKGIKLTTALYFTPNGRSIQAQGIEPDIIVTPAKITEIKTGTRVTEASLGKHLKNANTSKTVDKKAKPENNSDTKDNQLFEAVNLLRGLSILTKKQIQ